MKKIAVDAAVDTTIPEWAGLQQELIAGLLNAAPEFVARYTRVDGTLQWRASWAGMDGSDDPYEAFMYLALLHALTGDEQVYLLARRMWDSITWQWTQYGQISREFDRYYDWMHHGEGSLYLYFLGFTKPASVVDRQRAARFAAMYTGDDPLAPNYDPALNLIRAPHTGSDGPRFVLTQEDLSTHRSVLADYPPPFEDLRTVPGTAATCDWNDDGVFAEVLAAMNDRTTRGDVPVNLNATGLVTHAYLYSGDPAQREWVLRYLRGWTERARANGGIVPDNVGLSGTVGEYLHGAWWGGHYGWSWPHGLLTIIEPALNACLNAYLLTGDSTQLELVRTQLDAIYELGYDEDGRRHVPHKHRNAGWTDFRPASPTHAIQLWSQTLAEEDRSRVERTPARAEERTVRVPSVPFATKHYNLNSAAWYDFVTGAYPTFPEDALRANLELLHQQLARMRSPEGDPRGWDTLERLAGQVDGPSLQTDGYAIHAWQEFSPIYFESLIQLMWGAPAHISHGGLQFGTVRYFDAESGNPGLPVGVSAMVSALTAAGATLSLVNTSDEVRRIVVQAGSFREHSFDSVTLSTGSCQLVGGPEFEVDLAPRTSATLELAITRHSARPSYETHASPRASWSSGISGRTTEA